MKKYWFIFFKEQILLEICEDNTRTIPHSEQSPVEISHNIAVHNIAPFDDDDSEIKTFCVGEPIDLGEKYEFCGLREAYYKLNIAFYNKAGKCKEILYWDKNTQYCGTCGAPMRLNTDISKVCTKCGQEVWPQLATAIIVLISKGDEVFLVRGNNFRANFYGLVAGFVETGENLEEAVHREVLEETGIKIRNVRYFSSQAWPYPCGLMVGFYAEYESGEIRLQKEEIAAGNWFGRNNLPQIPEKLSIARRLIDSWKESF